MDKSNKGGSREAMKNYNHDSNQTFKENSSQILGSRDGVDEIVLNSEQNYLQSNDVSMYIRNLENQLRLKDEIIGELNSNFKLHENMPLRLFEDKDFGALRRRISNKQSSISALASQLAAIKSKAPSFLIAQDLEEPIINYEAQLDSLFKNQDDHEDNNQRNKQYFNKDNEPDAGKESKLQFYPSINEEAQENSNCQAYSIQGSKQEQHVISKVLRKVKQVQQITENRKVKKQPLSIMKQNRTKCNKIAPFEADDISENKDNIITLKNVLQSQIQDTKEENELMQRTSNMLEIDSNSLHDVQNYLSVLITIARYIKADIRKKQRAFKLGLFSITLVVAFITSLKSLVDISPIVNLRFSQDYAGRFDFSIQSSEYRFVDGDARHYDADLVWEEAEDTDDPEGVSQHQLKQIESGMFSESNDSIQVYGFNLLKFDYFQQKLDSLDDSQIFKGFAPRWTLPVKMRNITNPALSISSIIIIIDSERESIRKMNEHFSDEIIGKSELMASTKALEAIDVEAHRKEQVEIVFDILALIKIISDDQQANERYDQADLMPNTTDIIDMMKNVLHLDIDQENNLDLDLVQLFQQNFQQRNINLTVDTFNATQYRDEVPLYDNLVASLYQAEELLVDPFNPFDDAKLRDLIDGKVVFNLQELLEETIGDSEAVKIKIPLAEYIQQILNIEALPYSLSHNFTVIDQFDEANGKFSATFGNAILIDCHYANELLLSTYRQIFQLIIKNQPFLFTFVQDIDMDIENQIKSFSLCDYAQSIKGTLTDQVQVYIGSQEHMDQELSDAIKKILEALPTNTNITIGTPLKDIMMETGSVYILQNTIMVTVIAFLALISIKLIYSLMISDVQEKTYEFGMLRSLGFNKTKLMITIIVQGISFALPGLLIGMIVATVLNVAARHAIFSVALNEEHYYLSTGSVVVGVTIGLVVPIISNIFPIRRALGQNLRNSLDLYNRGKSETKIIFRKLEEIGLSAPQIALALMFIFLGILCFYVAPYSYLSQDYSLFFMIMNLLLMLMVIGLTMLSLLVLPMVHKQFIKLFLWFSPDYRKFEIIILNNMKSNLKRNTNTAIMFALCLSFLLFSGCSFQLFGKLATTGVANLSGADLYGFVYDEVNMPTFLDEIPISEYLQEQQDLDGAVLEWSFSSPNMKHLLRKLNPEEEDDTQISDLVGFKMLATNVYSIQENFLQTINAQYYFPVQIDDDKITQLKQEYNIIIDDVPNNGNKDVANLISQINPTDIVYDDSDPFDLTVSTNEFDPAFGNLENINVIVPEGFRDHLSFDTDRSARLCVGAGINECKMIYRMNIQAMVQKLPGWLGFSSYGIVQFFSDVLINQQQYYNILNDFLNTHYGTRTKLGTLIENYNFTDGIPKTKMFVKLKAQISEERRHFISNGIRSFVRNEGATVIDAIDAVQRIQKAMTISDIFTFILGTIALTLAFFLLMVSTTQNIRDSTHEYGCLRAMGLSHKQGMRIFMYEQYGLVLSALLLGSFSGLILSVTIVAQFFILLEFPLQMVIPYELIAFMFVMALVTTFFAVHVPVSNINQQPIAETIIQTSGK